MKRVITRAVIVGALMTIAATTLMLPSSFAQRLEQKTETKQSASTFVPASLNERYLYWESTLVKSQYANSCYIFARNSMERLHFQNIRVSTTEVVGSIGNVYAAVTCIETTPNITAVVMVIGNNDTETSKARDELSKDIASWTPID